MLAQIRNCFCYRATALGLLAVAAMSVSACATKKETALVSDPSAGPESALPWNRQEKWENQGQMGAAAERMSGSRR